MDDLWTLPLPLWDKMLRAAVGYLFLLVVFRIIGRRQLGQLTNFDLVVTLLVANVLQNATIGPDDSLVGGLVGAATLLALNTVVAGTVFVSRRASTSWTATRSSWSATARCSLVPSGGS